MVYVVVDVGNSEGVTRAFRFALDPSPTQERLLLSYCGAARFAFNWALGEVTGNLETRKTEREAGMPETELTPALSWSAFAFSKQWNAAKGEAAPWWRDVSMHAFRTGVTNCAAALDNWKQSNNGTRKGPKMRFPTFRRKGKARLSVRFVEINHQLSWLHADRHHVRLMLPQAPQDPELRRKRRLLEWIHTHGSTRRLYRLVETGRVTIQQVTISFEGGRWWVSFTARLTAPVARPARKKTGDVVGVDVGLKHLATLSQPVDGLTDEHGHVENPELLSRQLRRLRKLDRALARTEKGSKNHRRLLERRARLHGTVARTRHLLWHRLTRELAATFGTVVVEDLNIAGMANRKRHLGGKLADAGLAELCRQLAYKTAEHGHQLIVVDRWFPSSKTCSSCGTVKAKLELWERTYTCNTCDHTIDRDMNAALNLEAEGRAVLAGLRPERRNGDPRPGKTATTVAALAA